MGCTVWHHTRRLDNIFATHTRMKAWGARESLQLQTVNWRLSDLAGVFTVIRQGICIMSHILLSTILLFYGATNQLQCTNPFPKTKLSCSNIIEILVEHQNYDIFVYYYYYLFIKLSKNSRQLLLFGRN